MDPPTEDALTQLRYLHEQRFLMEDRLKIQAAKDKEKWDATLNGQELKSFKVNDYAMLRHESKKGLEFNWMGPYQVIKCNLNYNTYQIQEVDGKINSSWGSYR